MSTNLTHRDKLENEEEFNKLVSEARGRMGTGFFEVREKIQGKIYDRKVKNAQNKEANKKEQLKKAHQDLSHKSAIESINKYQFNLKVAIDMAIAKQRQAQIDAYLTKVQVEKAKAREELERDANLAPDSQLPQVASTAEEKERLDRLRKESEEAEKILTSNKQSTKLHGQLTRAEVEAYSAEAKKRGIKVDLLIKDHLKKLPSPKKEIRTKAFKGMQELRDAARKDYKKHGRELAKRYDELADGKRIIGGFKKGLPETVDPKLQEDRINRQERRAHDMKSDHGFYEAYIENCLAAGLDNPMMKLTSTKIKPGMEAYQAAAEIRNEARNATERAEYVRRPMGIWQGIKDAVRYIGKEKTETRIKHQDIKVESLRTRHAAINSVMDATLIKKGQDGIIDVYRRDVSVDELKDMKAYVKVIKEVGKDIDKARKNYKEIDLKFEKSLQNRTLETSIEVAKMTFDVRQAMVDDLKANPHNVKTLNERNQNLNSTTDILKEKSKKLDKAESISTQERTYTGKIKTATRKDQDKAAVADYRHDHETDGKLFKATYFKDNKPNIQVPKKDTEQLNITLKSLNQARAMRDENRKELFVQKNDSAKLFASVDNEENAKVFHKYLSEKDNAKDKVQETSKLSSSELEAFQMIRKEEMKQAKYDFTKELIKDSEKEALIGKLDKLNNLDFILTADNALQTQIDRRMKKLEKSEKELLESNYKEYGFRFSSKTQARMANDVAATTDLQNDLLHAQRMQDKLRTSKDPKVALSIVPTAEQTKELDRLIKNRNKLREKTLKANLSLEEKLKSKAKAEEKYNKDLAKADYKLKVNEKLKYGIHLLKQKLQNDPKFSQNMGTFLKNLENDIDVQLKQNDIKIFDKIEKASQTKDQTKIVQAIKELEKQLDIGYEEANILVKTSDNSKAKIEELNKEVKISQAKMDEAQKTYEVARSDVQNKQNQLFNVSPNISLVQTQIKESPIKEINVTEALQAQPAANQAANPAVSASLSFKAVNNAVAATNVQEPIKDKVEPPAAPPKAENIIAMTTPKNETNITTPDLAQKETQKAIKNETPNPVTNVNVVKAPPIPKPKPATVEQNDFSARLNNAENDSTQLKTAADGITVIDPRVRKVEVEPPTFSQRVVRSITNLFDSFRDKNKGEWGHRPAFDLNATPEAETETLGEKEKDRGKLKLGK